MSAELEDMLAEADVEGAAEGKKPPPPKRLGNEKKREEALSIAKSLDKLFIWTETPEGDDYWREIYNRLRVLGGSA